METRSSVTLLSQGQKIFGILHLPEAKKDQKVPAVLFCHGFGGHKSGKFRLSVRQAERLSQAGIASLRVDFRGSGDSEGSFANTTIQTQSTDARVAADFLLSHPAIDRAKFAILGRSLGGAIATMLAAELTLVKALALWCPVFDAKPWLQGRHSGYILGQKLSAECIQQFARLNVAPSLALLSHVPLFIAQGAKDEILGRYHFEQYVQGRKTCPETELVELAESNHEFAPFDEQQILLDTTTSWLQKILY